MDNTRGSDQVKAPSPEALARRKAAQDFFFAMRPSLVRLGGIITDEEFEAAARDKYPEAFGNG